MGNFFLLSFILAQKERFCNILTCKSTTIFCCGKLEKKIKETI